MTDMKTHIAAIDQGTTSTRCIIFSDTGPVASSQKEHRQILPRAGWVEHDPVEIWEATQEVVSDAIEQAGIRGDAIAAVGIANQRETTVVWDKRTGRPFGNAIVWQDTRTKEICDALTAGSSQDRFRAITGLPLATYFSGPKIQWILENRADARHAADRGDGLFGTIDTWLIWNLTGGAQGGVHVTDPTNASRTMLMSLDRLDWDESMLDVFGVPRSMLPRIVPSSISRERFVTRNDGAFGAAIPIAGILGDQQAALVGQTCFDAGESKNTYGTGCFMLLNTGGKIVQSTAGLLTTVAYQFGDSATYALEGSVAVGGSLVQWLRDNLGLISTSAEIQELAQSVSDNGGVYVVPAFSGLFAPHWRSDARGLIIGLTRHTNKAHVARAALEATAYQSRDILEAMHRDCDARLSSLKVDGGMAVNDLLMQFQADILGIPVIRPKLTETTALGAAYAAGLGMGVYRMDELRARWQEDRRFMPRMEAEDRERLYGTWQKAVTRSFGWL